MLRPIWLGRNENLLFPPAISHAVNEEGKTQRKCATGSSVAAQHDAALNSTCHRFLPMLGCCLLQRASEHIATFLLYPSNWIRCLFALPSPLWASFERNFSERLVLDRSMSSQGSTGRTFLGRFVALFAKSFILR